MTTDDVTQARSRLKTALLAIEQADANIAHRTLEIRRLLRLAYKETLHLDRVLATLQVGEDLGPVSAARPVATGVAS